MTLNIHNGGVWNQGGQSTVVHVAGAWQPLKQGWVHAAGAWQQFFESFNGQTDTYAVAGAYTETIPSGAVNLVLEEWGASAGGGPGSGTGCGAQRGTGGSSGGYCRSTFALTSADWGKTLAVLVGTGGTGNADGTGSTVSSGTKAIAEMFANGGRTAGGSPGTASGGSVANITGNVGVIPTGGAGVLGVNGRGNSGGAGGIAGSGHAGFPGGDGLVIFTYS